MALLREGLAFGLWWRPQNSFARTTRLLPKRKYLKNITTEPVTKARETYSTNGFRRDK